MIRMIRRLCFRLFGDVPDPAWVQQKPVEKFAGYDPKLAAAAWKRSRRGMPRTLYLAASSRAPARSRAASRASAAQGRPPAATE